MKHEMKLILIALVALAFGCGQPSQPTTEEPKAELPSPGEVWITPGRVYSDKDNPFLESEIFLPERKQLILCVKSGWVQYALGPKFIITNTMTMGAFLSCGTHRVGAVGDNYITIRREPPAIPQDLDSMVIGHTNYLVAHNAIAIGCNISISNDWELAFGGCQGIPVYRVTMTSNEWAVVSSLLFRAKAD